MKTDKVYGLKSPKKWPVGDPHGRWGLFLLKKPAEEAGFSLINNYRGVYGNKDI
jgi:hypothetical protein